MNNKSLNSPSDHKDTSEKKKSWDYFSIAIATGAVVALFYLTNIREGFDSALLTVAIVLVFSFSFRIPCNYFERNKKWDESGKS